MKSGFLYWLFAVAFVTLIGCEKHGPEVSSFEVIDVEADEAAKLVASGTVAVLDVRTQGEWDSGHIEGAVFCPISDPNFEENVAKLDYSRPFVVH